MNATCEKITKIPKKFTMVLILTLTSTPCYFACTQQHIQQRNAYIKIHHRYHWQKTEYQSLIQRLCAKWNLRCNVFDNGISAMACPYHSTLQGRHMNMYMLQGSYYDQVSSISILVLVRSIQKRIHVLSSLMPFLAGPPSNLNSSVDLLILQRCLL